MGPEFYLPLALLFLASADPSRAQNAEAAVAVVEGDPLTVECALRVEQRAQWRFEGAEPPADLAPAPEAAPGGRLTARLHAPRARPAHAGLYTCGPGAEQRVRVAVLPASAPAPAPEPEPAPAPTPGAGDAQPTGAGAGADADAAPSSLPPKLLYYDVGRPFELNCTDDATPPPGAYVWKVNGTLVERVEALKGRYKVLEKGAKFRVEGRSHEDDFGLYTCGVEGVTSEATVWEVRGRPVVKLQPNSNVVEGQKLRLVCRLVGKPYPAVEWRLHNETIVDAPNRTEGLLVAAVLGARVAFNASEQGVAGAELVVDPAERPDAGVYECVPLDGEAVRGETTLRVKDKYAALWPFLGICAEVFVLCAIILIYEKRRSKPELDDSDTDNHDQKKS